MILPDASFCQANFRFSGPACPSGAEVTLGFRIGVGGVVLPEDQAEVMVTAWNGTIRTVQSNQVTLDEVYVKAGPNATGPDGSFPSGASGAIGGNCSPPSVAVLVRKSTATGGKRGRGRMYWPGVPEDYINSAGELPSGSLSAWQTQATAFRQYILDSLLPPVLLHSPGISVVPAPLDITAFTVLGVAGTQRQRMRR